MRVQVQSFTQAAPDVAWLAYNTTEHIPHWNAASPDWHCPRSELDLRPGGRFCHRMEARDRSAGFDFEGEFTRVQAPQLLEYRMDDGRMALVQFHPDEGGTRVTVAFDPDQVYPLEAQRQGWQSILDNFARYAGQLDVG